MYFSPSPKATSLMWPHFLGREGALIRGRLLYTHYNKHWGLTNATIPAYFTEVIIPYCTFSVAIYWSVLALKNFNFESQFHFPVEPAENWPKRCSVFPQMDAGCLFTGQGLHRRGWRERSCAGGQTAKNYSQTPKPKTVRSPASCWNRVCNSCDIFYVCVKFSLILLCFKVIVYWELEIKAENFTY